MGKTLVITIVLIVLAVLLVLLAVRQPTVTTQPVQPIPQPQELPTPRAPVQDIGTPTPKAPEEIKAPQAGIEMEKAIPQEINFWVNDIRVPESTTYAEGLNFIPIKQNDIKTFAGSFGPYFEDPTQHITVVLCAEYYKVQAAPACERVQLLWRDNYVSFARGYQFDEYIGGMAAKDYVAYYTIFAGEAPVGYSNKAVIRTVKD